MAIPVVSIVICTRDRITDLRETLAAIGRTCVPNEMSCELIVVDNGLSDGTAGMVRECHLPNMPVRYVSEPRPGKGYAYNAGLAAAQGQVLLFTDDDVRPPTDWVAGMCMPILSGEADAVAGGVQLAPHLERPWMDAFYRGNLATTDELDPEHPWAMVGANMAFGHHVLARVPAFDPELGPGALGLGDESLFSWQLRAAGYRLASAFDVTVEHHPDVSRLKREYFLATAQKLGRSMGYVAYHWRHDPYRLPRLRLLCLLMELTALRAVRRTRHPEYAPKWEMGLVQRIAQLQQYLRECSRPRQYEKQGLVKRNTVADAAPTAEAVGRQYRRSQIE